MGADRCLDCGYLHAPNTAKSCRVCESPYLVYGVNGDLDTAWMAHRSGFPEGTVQARRAWGDLVVSVLTNARVERALWRDFGWYHAVLVPGGGVHSFRQVTHDLCHWS